jgi:hypothetical protein
VSGRMEWTQAEENILSDLYPLMPLRDVPAALAKRTGRLRTAESIQCKASRMNLDYRQADGLFSLQQAADAAEVSIGVVWYAIHSSKVQTVGKGKARFLRVKQVERLMEIYPPSPGKWVTRGELMRRLGYGEAHSSRLLRAGVIRGIRSGGRWLVDADHLDEVEREMRQSGVTRLDLSTYPTFDEMRRECREYGRRRYAEVNWKGDVAE